MTYEEFDKWAAEALITVSKVYPSGDFENWKRCALHLPHIRAVLQFSTESMTEDPDVLCLLSMTALYLWS
jgi:hypothetical protein